MKILAVVCLIAFVAALPGQGASGAGGIIRIEAITVRSITVEVGKHGPSAGDQRISGLLLRDRRGRTIGNGYRVCTSLGRVLPISAALCEMVLNLPRGKLVAQGTRQRRDYYVLPVVGGTRIYSTTQGTLIASTFTLGPRRERLLISLES